MGIIISQSFRNSFVIYLGAILGVLSSLMVYPLVIETVGLINVIYMMSIMTSQFANFGSPMAMIKYAPSVKSKTGDDIGLFSFSLILSTLGFSFLTILGFLFYGYFKITLSFIGFNFEVIEEHTAFFITLAFLLMIAGIQTVYINIQKNITLPNLIQNLGYKIFLPVVLLLLFYKVITLSQLLTIYLTFFVILNLILFRFILKLNSNVFSFNFAFLDGELRKELKSYIPYSMLNGISAQLAFRLDIIMLGLLVDIKIAGIYTILFFLAGLIDVPNRSINQIAAPIISEAWEKNDQSNLNNIYKKSSLNSMILSLLIFGAIWVSIDSIFSLSLNTRLFNDTHSVFLCLGIAKVIDSVTSVNSSIITFSNFYRYNLLFVFVLGIINIVLNYFLINDYGILGASLATLIAVTLYNLIKFIFIQVKMDLSPFSHKTVYVIGLFAVIVVTVSQLPDSGIAILDLALKSGLFVSIYSFLILYFKISTDIQNTVMVLLQKLGLKSKINFLNKITENKEN